MGNRNFIERALQHIEEVHAALKGWAAKSEIMFEEQKAVADKLSQTLSEVWSISCISETAKVATEKSNEDLKRITEYREILLKTLTGLRDELDKTVHTVEEPSIDVTPAAKKAMAEPAKPLIEHKEASQKPQPATPPKKEIPTQTPTAIVDMFVTHGANEPALLTPIVKLGDNIGLSDRFMFIKELFGNNSELFVATIGHIDTLHTLDEAHNYLYKELPNINRTGAIAKQFETLLVRRFMKR